MSTPQDFWSMLGHFTTLRMKGLSRICKTVGTFFSEKAFHKEPIALYNNNKTISNNEELAEIWQVKHVRLHWISWRIELLDVEPGSQRSLENQRSQCSQWWNYF